MVIGGQQMFVITKPFFGFGTGPAEIIFLANTYGYGPAWSKNEDDAWVFDSHDSAKKIIAHEKLHNVRVENLLNFWIERNEKNVENKYF